jgi:hypothetical protein
VYVVNRNASFCGKVQDDGKGEMSKIEENEADAVRGYLDYAIVLLP